MLQVKPKAKRQSGAKKPKFSEPFVDKLGWNVEPPSLIWRSAGPEGGVMGSIQQDMSMISQSQRALVERGYAGWSGPGAACCGSGAQDPVESWQHLMLILPNFAPPAWLQPAFCINAPRLSAGEHGCACSTPACLHRMHLAACVCVCGSACAAGHLVSRRAARRLQHLTWWVHVSGFFGGGWSS